MIEAVTRLLPGVMGNEASSVEESFSDGRLEYPQYTRPAEFRGWAVPEVLRSGDHGRVARWRAAQSLRRTLERRPDLVPGPLDPADAALLAEFPRRRSPGQSRRLPERRAFPLASRVALARARVFTGSPLMHRTDLVDRAGLRDDVPDFGPGDTLKVHVRVVEGNRERVQVFQGAVIRRQGGGVRETFSVRKISFGVGVERTFPVHSPIIAKIEVVSRGDVRRAKLYYLRDRIGKAAKIKEKRF